MSELIQQIRYKGTKHQADSPSLSLQNVYAAYPASGNRLQSKRWAVENISFGLTEGEQIAIIGPNGAGKSTLFKLVAGMLKPDRGTIKMFGQSPDRHICIAYVPQSNMIDWSFPVTVEDVVMMGRTRQIGLFRRPSRRDREIVQQSLARVDAVHFAKKQIGELSGGQQQRVFIARALALETNLLLMDEPLAGLDGPAQEKIFEILESLRPYNVTVLVATHDLNQLATRFDRIMLLNRRVVAFGEGTAVLNTENMLAAYGGAAQATQYAQLARL